MNSTRLILTFLTLFHIACNSFSNPLSPHVLQIKFTKLESKPSIMYVDGNHHITYFTKTDSLTYSLKVIDELDQLSKIILNSKDSIYIKSISIGKLNVYGNELKHYFGINTSSVISDSSLVILDSLVEFTFLNVLLDLLINSEESEYLHLHGVINTNVPSKLKILSNTNSGSSIDINLLNGQNDFFVIFPLKVGFKSCKFICISDTKTTWKISALEFTFRGKKINFDGQELLNSVYFQTNIVDRLNNNFEFVINPEGNRKKSMQFIINDLAYSQLVNWAIYDSIGTVDIYLSNDSQFDNFVISTRSINDNISNSYQNRYYNIDNVYSFNIYGNIRNNQDLEMTIRYKPSMQGIIAIEKININLNDISYQLIGQEILKYFIASNHGKATLVNNNQIVVSKVSDDPIVADFWPSITTIEPIISRSRERINKILKPLFALLVLLLLSVVNRRILSKDITVDPK